MAAATVIPRKISAITSLSFHTASAAATIPITTSVATAARFAVSFISPGILPSATNPPTPMVSAHEQVFVEERRHGIVLAGSFVRAAAVAAPGVVGVAVGWPATALGA